MAAPFALSPKDPAVGLPPIDDFRGPYRWLSNFGLDAFTWRGLVWSTSEHAYQAAKTDDPARYEQVRQAPTPREARNLGQLVALRPTWEAEKAAVMRSILWAKFTQNPGLAARLCATDGRELVEGTTWHDNFWGTCRCATCGDHGANNLGKILTEIRDDLLLVRSAPAKRPHPASFPPQILAVLREVIPKGRVLDPFGGVGKLGRLGPEWEVTSLELEPEWAWRGYENGCAKVIVGDATRLPFPDASWSCLATSPCYGSRLADTYAPPDYGHGDERRSHRTRRTYTLALGRALSENNAGAMQWGFPYCELHTKALFEFSRVLVPGGLFVLDIKDHVRDGKAQGVPAWWVAAAYANGFPEVVERRLVPLKGDQNTARMRKQGHAVVDVEEIIVFRRST